MSLKERITEDMKSAMRSGEKERLATIRLITAAIKQREVDERITLDDVQVLSVIEKMVKQRKESIVQFEAGGRAEGHCCLPVAWLRSAPATARAARPGRAACSPAAWCRCSCCCRR